MKVEIITRSFVELAGGPVELNEHLAQHPDSAERHWSSCCIFLPSPGPDAYAELLRAEIKQKLIEVVPAHTPESGVWIRGPHYQLAAAVEAMGMAWKNA
jgi:hypothetical protein